jgi:hypothetical protein
MTKKPKVLIFGAGGHGWKTVSDLLISDKFDFSIYTSTADYGGAQGVWYRLLEYNDFELSKKLFGEITGSLPFGDLNKILTFFLSRKFGSLVGDLLNYRSDSLEKLKLAFEELAIHLGFEKVISDDFESFLELGFKYYQNHKHNLDYQTEKEFCLGYPFADYLLWKLEKMSAFNSFYQKKLILPKNIHLDFIAENRQILVAIDLNGVELESEHIIDIHKVPILPESLKILETDGKSSKFKDGFLRKLKSSDWVILPNGSIANWLPILNNPKVTKILQQKSEAKKLIWLINSGKTENEFYLKDYLKYLKSLNLNPILIGPKSFEKDSFSPKVQDKLQDFGGASEYIKVYDLNKKAEIDTVSLSSFLVEFMG